MNATTQAEVEVLENSTNTALATQTDTVTKALAEVSTSNLRLTELAQVARELHVKFKDVAFDVSTVKGMAEAKSARLQLRQEARFPMQTLKEAGSKMLGQMQRQFNAKADELIGEVAGYEKPIDEQIKAEEDRKAAEKARREQEEREAAALVQARIDGIRGFLVSAVGVQPEAIAALIAELDAIEITLPEFGDRAGEALQLKVTTLDKLGELHAAGVADAQAKAKFEEERAELARQRAEQEAREKADRERIAAEQLAAAEKLAIERAAFEQEQATARAEAKAREDADRARRDEEDRLAREARAAEDKRIADARAALEAEQRAVREAAEAKAAAERKAAQEAEDAAAAAERKRLDDEAAADRAVQQRLADEARAEHQRKGEERERQEASRQRVRDASPAMHDALRQWRAAERDNDTQELANARAARDEVLAQLEGTEA